MNTNLHPNDTDADALCTPLVSRTKPKKNIFRGMRYNFLRVLRLHDAAYKLALPMAFACALVCVPTFGLGAVITFFFAWATKVSKLAGVLMSVAVTPLAPLCYLADALLAHQLFPPDIAVDAWQEASSLGVNSVQSNVPLLEQLRANFENVISLGWTWFLASFIIAAIVFVVTYPIFNRLVKKIQAKRLERFNKQNNMLTKEGTS